MKTPDQLMMSLDEKRQAILDRLIPLIEKHLAANFVGDPLEYTSYLITPTEAKLILVALQSYMGSYGWHISISRTESTYRDSYVTFKITPMSKIYTASAEDYYNK